MTSVTRALLATPQAAEAVNGGPGVGPPLIAAASHGHVEVVRLLLAAGADINTTAGVEPNVIYGTALHFAADRGHLAVVQALLAAGASKDARSVNGAEETPLLCAAGSGHLPVVEALLAAGADVQARTARGASPLFLACQNGHTECVRALLRAGADVSYSGKGASGERVFSGCHAVSVLAVWQALPPWHTLAPLSTLSAPLCRMQITIRDCFGCNILHSAARSKTAIVSQLLEAGATGLIDVPDADGHRPLHAAAKNGCHATAEQLIGLGAAVDAASCSGQTPLSFAVDSLLEALMDCTTAGAAVAIKARYSEIVQYLLDCGANPNATWGANRMSPLIFACQGSPFGANTQVVKALLQAGADPEQADAQGNTPLMVANLQVVVVELSGQAARDQREVAELLQAAIAAKAQAR